MTRGTMRTRGEKRLIIGQTVDANIKEAGYNRSQHDETSYPDTFH